MESYFDIIFALNEQTHPGEKRLIQLCKKNCKILPDKFEENIDKLMKDLFTHSDMAVEDLTNIITELEKILEK